MDLIFKILTHNFSNCFTCDNPYIIQLISNLTRKLLQLSNKLFTIGFFANLFLLDNSLFEDKIISLIENGVTAYIQAYQSRTNNQNKVTQNAITIYTTIRISKVFLEYKPEKFDQFFEAFLQISKIFIELFDNRKFFYAPIGRKATDEDEDLLLISMIIILKKGLRITSSVSRI